MQEKGNCPMMKQEHESNFVNLYFFTLRQEIPRFLKPDLTSLTGFQQKIQHQAYDKGTHDSNHSSCLGILSAVNSLAI